MLTRFIARAFEIAMGAVLRALGRRLVAHAHRAPTHDGRKLLALTGQAMMEVEVKQ